MDNTPEKTVEIRIRKCPQKVHLALRQICLETQVSLETLILNLLEQATKNQQEEKSYAANA